MRIFKKAILILLMCNFSVGYAGGPLDALMNYSDTESEDISINRPHIITEQGGGFLRGGLFYTEGLDLKTYALFIYKRQVINLMLVQALLTLDFLE